MNFCLTLSEPRLAALQSKIDRHHGRVSHIEVRLDGLREGGLPRLPESGTEFIATCRPAREGGGWEGPEGRRLDRLRAAAEAGFDWLDVEHDVEPPPSLPPGVRVLRSLHRFDVNDIDAESDLDRLAALPGDLIKLAVAVPDTKRLTRLLLAMERRQVSKPRVVLGMGELGQASRYLGAWLGNAWTYVAEEHDRPVAPGQFDLRQARTCLWPERVSTATEIYGVLGRPIAHSLSPALHNRLFRHYGLEKVYLPLELDDPQPWFSYLERSRLPFRGFSVTLPYKQRVLRFLESVESPVEAVNTLRRTARGWAGSNTDLEGFLRPLLRAGVRLSNREAMVLGYGGVARSVVRALMAEGAKVTVTGRDPDKASAFAHRQSCAWTPWGQVPNKGDLLVNTTPVGQFPDIHRCPIDAERADFEIVYDLIYHPRETRLLKSAKARGARVFSGLDMFIEQAALQFEAWTGLVPDRGLMVEILEETLSGE